MILPCDDTAIVVTPIWGLAQTKQAQLTKKSGAILREELRRTNSIALLTGYTVNYSYSAKPK